jgi:hypothetical protein
MSVGDTAKVALDGAIGGAGIAMALKVVPVATALLGIVLIVLRIIIGVQEYRINRARLGGK